MTGISALLLPILLSTVLIFFVSAAINMAVPSWHSHDYRGVSGEDKVRDALRSFAIPPGDYSIPFPASGKEARSAAFSKKLEEGPVMILSVAPNGPMPLGISLVQWVLYTTIVGLFAAYVAGRALPIGAPYLHVFRFAGVTSFLAYTAALCQMSIWYRRSWGTTLRATVDGLVYALITAGTFGWLWPR